MGVPAFHDSFSIGSARLDQLTWGYLPDEWSMANLSAGSTVLGGLPGQSAYYTTHSTLEAAGRSREALFNSLQVLPHPEFGYRPKMGVYEVQQPISVPFGTVQANPNLGVGMGDQYFIQNYQNYLKLVGEIDLGQ